MSADVSGSTAADLVLVGGRVWTDRDAPTDDSGPTAVAIRNGTVVDVGDDDRIRALAGEDTELVELGGRRVVPGLVDSHIHAVRAGWSYLDELDWTEVHGLVAALDSVRSATSTRPDGKWITALGGWHPTQFAEARMPTRDELDAAAPAHPVFVHPLYGHDDFGVLNSAALTRLGWTGACPDPDGGVLLRAADGTPDGRLSGLAAYQQVTAVALNPAPWRARESTRAFFARLAGLGLTGVVDAGGLGMRPDRYHPLRAVWRAGELPVRVRTNLGATTRGAEPREVDDWQKFLDPALGDELLSVLGIGEIVHLGCHDWEGMSPFEISDDAYAEFVAMGRELAASRWPMTVHAILDSSITRILDGIEEIARDVPVEGLRWNLCHAECISARNLERVRSLGLGLALQSRLGHKAGVCAQRWGDEAVINGPPLGDIVAAGIPFGAGTDATRGSSYNPWRALWWFVTGRSQDNGPRRGPEHRLGRAEALHAYTRGSTWFSFEDDRRGFLAPGADADLAVLSADYFVVDEDEIPAVTSDLTVVRGRVVHTAGAFGHVRRARHRSRPAPAVVVS